MAFFLIPSDMEDLLLINNILKIPSREQVKLLVNFYPGIIKMVQSIRTGMMIIINAKPSIFRILLVMGNLSESRKKGTINVC